jgi:phosphatidate cytidylyltransferase
MPEPAPPPSTPPTKAAIFFRRPGSFAVLWTIVLAALFSPYKMVSDYFFLVIMMFLAGAGLTEFYGMVDRMGHQCYAGWGVFGGLLLLAATFVDISGEFGFAAGPSRINDFESSFFILFVLGLCIRQFLPRASTTGIVAIATTLFGLMYIPWLLNFIQKINFFTPPVEAHYYPGGTLTVPAHDFFTSQVEGRYYLLYFVLVTKFSDCGAYAVGSLIGRHKMIPRISPGKTWEGFAGAVLVSTAASVAFAALAGRHLAGMTWWHAIILGVILSVGAVVGDLIESLFKREAGLKDSGRLFPGIGGILDLLDSLLFNAPLMYLYLRHILSR